jgi:hypothetical protein
MFANLADWFARRATLYPKLGTVVPGFIAVHCRTLCPRCPATRRSVTGQSG